MKPSSWAGPVYAGAAQNSVQEQPAERFPGLPYAPRMQAVSRPKSPNALWQAAGFRSFPTPRRPSRQDGKKLCPTSKGLSTAKGARRRQWGVAGLQNRIGQRTAGHTRTSPGAHFSGGKGEHPYGMRPAGDAGPRCGGYSAVPVWKPKSPHCAALPAIFLISFIQAGSLFFFAFLSCHIRKTQPFGRAAEAGASVPICARERTGRGSVRSQECQIK